MGDSSRVGSVGVKGDIRSETLCTLGDGDGNNGESLDLTTWHLLLEKVSFERKFRKIKGFLTKIFHSKPIPSLKIAAEI